MEGLNYHHLLYFRMVAREGSIAKAAELMNVSQPTISEQIRSLEKRVAKPLFNRDGRRLVLTDAGRTALRYAEDIHALGDEMLDRLGGNIEPRQELIRVGIMQGLTASTATQLVGMFGDETTRCLVTVASAETLLEQFKAGALDLALTQTNSGAGSNTITLGVGVFGTPQVARKYKAQFPRTLHNAPLLVTSVAHRDLNAWLASKRLRATVKVESADSSIVETLARDGRGMAVLAGHAPEGLVPIGSLKGASLTFHLLASAKHAGAARTIASKLRRLR